MSEKAESSNILKNKGAKTRRTAEYFKTPGAHLTGVSNLSFTDQELSAKD
jgi:hypothetical protein